MVSFRGKKKKAWATPRLVSFRGLIQNFRWASPPLSYVAFPPGSKTPLNDSLHAISKIGTDACPWALSIPGDKHCFSWKSEGEYCYCFSKTLYRIQTQNLQFWVFFCSFILFKQKKKNSPFHLTVSNIYNKQKLFVIEAIIYSFIDAFIWNLIAWLQYTMLRP